MHVPARAEFRHRRTRWPAGCPQRIRRLGSLRLSHPLGRQHGMKPLWLELALCSVEISHHEQRLRSTLPQLTRNWQQAPCGRNRHPVPRRSGLGRPL